jgi:hypothetical protein
MPYQVTEQITADDLRLKDVVVAGVPNRFHHPTPFTVTGITRKMVNAVVTFESGDGAIFTVTVRLDTKVTVHRSKPTPQETARKEREQTVWFLRNKLENLIGDADPFTKLEETVAKARAANYAELVDKWHLDSFLKAQASWKIGRLIQHLYEKIITEQATTVPPNGESLEDFAIFEAWAMFYANKTREERRFGQVPDPTSRSTSSMANLYEDLDRWAVDKLLESIRWYAERDLEVRAAELVEEWKNQ